MTETQSPAEDAVAAALGNRFPHAAEGLERYARILATTGIEWGLLGPREADRIWARHLANSLALVDLLPQGVDVADVGSGAGLPGIPLAVARPDLRLTLLEPLLRRATFLTQTVEELGLGERVQVERVRAEDFQQTFDVVTCRAVASLDKLLRWTTPLFLPHGRLIALKGSSAADEVGAAQRLLERHGLQAQVRTVRAAAGTTPTYAIAVQTA